MQTNKPLYLAADYNDWEPGDEKFSFQKLENGIYFLFLENTPERFEYKITQGQWATVEGDSSGNAIPNRFYIKGSGVPEVKIVVRGWEATTSYLIKVNKIPKDTPEDAAIFITGNFNKWNPRDPNYKLKKLADGSYQTKIYTSYPTLEYKFTRGSWESVEARLSGRARPNRVTNLQGPNSYGEINADILGWEDLDGSFSVYSLYDLLLLFAVFQNVLLLFILPTFQNTNRTANKWLMLTMLVSAISICGYVISNFGSVVQQYPKMLLISELALFLYAPLFYFYLRHLLFNFTELPSRWYLQFVPVLLQLLVFLPYIFLPEGTMLQDLMSKNSILSTLFFCTGILGLVWNTYYWFVYLKKINYYKKEIASNFSFDYNINYLNTILVLQFLVLFFWTAFFILIFLSKKTELDFTPVIENTTDFIWLLFSFFVFVLGYYGIKQPEVFRAAPKSLSALEDFVDTTLKHEEPESQKVEENAHKLKQYMESQKPFTNPKLSLGELAQSLDLSAHELSKVINQYFEMNFFEYINSYRIEEFKVQIKKNENRQLTLLALAYEVGFNSKTAFNRAFKKQTGKTPKEFFENGI